MSTIDYQAACGHHDTVKVDFSRIISPRDLKNVIELLHKAKSLPCAQCYFNEYANWLDANQAHNELIARFHCIMRHHDEIARMQNG